MHVVHAVLRARKLHNIMHNMDDEDVPFASHITKRGRIYQYVRRVPEDLADAFPFSRISDRCARSIAPPPTRQAPVFIRRWKCSLPAPAEKRARPST